MTSSRHCYSQLSAARRSTRQSAAKERSVSGSSSDGVHAATAATTTASKLKDERQRALERTQSEDEMTRLAGQVEQQV